MPTWHQHPCVYQASTLPLPDWLEDARSIGRTWTAGDRTGFRGQQGPSGCRGSPGGLCALREVLPPGGAAAEASHVRELTSGGTPPHSSITHRVSAGNQLGGLENPESIFFSRYKKKHLPRKEGGRQPKNESWRSVIYTTDGEGRPPIQHGPSKAAGWGRGCQGGGPLQGPGQGMLQPRAPVLLNPNG